MTWLDRARAWVHAATAPAECTVVPSGCRDKTAQPWFLNAQGEPERWLFQGLTTVAIAMRLEDGNSRQQWQGRVLHLHGHASGQLVALSRRFSSREEAMAACDEKLRLAGWRLL